MIVPSHTATFDQLRSDTMSQIQKNVGDPGEGDDEVGQVAKTADTASADSLLDEIDDILETNAEEFVKSYVQKGGQ